MTGERSAGTITRRILEAATAAVPALVVFVSYFITLGRLENDHFVIIARARQVLLGSWPVRDFIDPGMPLTYLPSAAAAAVAGPTLLTEAVLSITLVALTTAIAFLIVRQTTGSLALAVAAAALTFAFPTRLYSATKVATLCFALWLGARYAREPTGRRLLLFGAWTGVAFLVRFDYAVYIAGAALVLLVVNGEHLTRRITSSLVYLCAALAITVPWFVYVEIVQGLREYIVSAVQFAEAERIRTAASLPWFHWPMAQDSNTAPLLFYLFLSIPAAGLALAASLPRSPARSELAYVATLTLLCDLAFLRDAVWTRLGDAIPQTAVLAAYVVSRALPRRALAPIGVVTATAAAAFGLQSFVQQGGSVYPATAMQQWNDMARRLRGNDPELVTGPLFATLASYIMRCTPPGERVIVSGFAPEIPVLAKRGFAGGLPAWLLGYYVLPSDVRIIERHLSREEVGAVVLLEGSTVFVRSWPSVASRLIETGFEEYAVSAESPQLHVWLLPVEARDAETGLPCRPG